MMAPAGALVRIPLTKGYVALVDPEDAYLAAMKWYAHVFKKSEVVYAARRVQRPDGKWTLQYLHQAVLGAKGGDHKNGDGLDCRRGNLRLASKAQNQRNQRRRIDNRSGFKGVSWHVQRGYWRVEIKAGPVRRCLHGFATADAAARAYDALAKQLHGEFARLNFPEAT